MDRILSGFLWAAATNYALQIHDLKRNEKVRVILHRFAVAGEILNPAWLP